MIDRISRLSLTASSLLIVTGLMMMFLSNVLWCHFTAQGLPDAYLSICGNGNSNHWSVSAPGYLLLALGILPLTLRLIIAGENRQSS
ncbi:hypothetical protein ACPV5O_20935 [Vibrio maritimus]|uniref:hypothetical protein n=1 Tax=Vibrio maritimus TaxID=990268 RepID=UPI004067BB36